MMTDNELLIQYLLTKRKLKQLSKYNDSCFSLVQIFLEHHLSVYQEEILNRRTNSNNIDIHKYSHEVLIKENTEYINLKKEYQKQKLIQKKNKNDNNI